MDNIRLVIIPVITGISEVFKRLGLPVKFVPLINLLLGIIIGILIYISDISSTKLLNEVIQGVIFGLSASGFYSSVKNVKEGITSS